MFFAVSLVRYSFQPWEMRIHSFPLVHGWSLTWSIDSILQGASRIQSFACPNRYQTPGDVEYAVSPLFDLPDPDQAIPYVAFGPWVEVGAMV